VDIYRVELAIFCAVFTALTAQTSSRQRDGLVATLSLAWHLLITQVFCTTALRAFYLRIERGVNGVAGAGWGHISWQRRNKNRQKFPIKEGNKFK
jgi:hypothetical protein